mgnify:CR=1 FL=1
MAEKRLNKDAIRAANPIEQVIHRYGVELKPAGRKDGRPVFKGHCPFHADRDPSFTVYAAQGRFYCYGCDAHGDVFTFVMQLAQVDFSRAVEILSGGTAPTIKRLSPPPKPQLELVLEDEHFQLIQAAAALYHTALVNPPAAHAPRAHAARVGWGSEGAGDGQTAVLR